MTSNRKIPGDIKQQTAEVLHYDSVATTINPALSHAFLQAVIDDDSELVCELLKATPHLLIVTPPSDMEIESQRTWLKFKAENALIMAIKLKLANMTALLFSSFVKLVPGVHAAEIAAVRAAGMQQLVQALSDAAVESPPRYTRYFESLIKLFTAETFPHGTQVNAKLSDETEAELRHFRKIMLPKQVITLADNVDVELMLQAALEVYTKHNWRTLSTDQRNAFLNRVIGFLQSLVTPETAKILCRGLSFVLDYQSEIRALVGEPLFADGTAFYRPARNAHTGLGFEFMCTVRGRPESAHDWYDVSVLHSAWRKLIRQKRKSFAEIFEFTEAFKLANNRAEAFIILGNAYAVNGNHSDALLYYTEALKLKPKSAEAFCKRGDILFQQNNKVAAILNYARALQIVPRSERYTNKLYRTIDTWYPIGGALSKENLFEAIKTIPNNADAKFLLIQCLEAEHPLGEVFWRARGENGCTLNSGILLEIRKHLKRIDPNFERTWRAHEHGFFSDQQRTLTARGPFNNVCDDNRFEL